MAEREERAAARHGSELERIERNGPVFAAVFVASLAAGPIYVATGLVAAALFAPPEMAAGMIGDYKLLLIILFLAMAVGFFLAFIPNIVGTVAMARLAERWPPARTPVAWAAAGLLLGGLIVTAKSSHGSVGIDSECLLATSVACALIAWRFVRPDRSARLG